MQYVSREYACKQVSVSCASVLFPSTVWGDLLRIHTLELVSEV
jgi:hypothetical protein